MEENSVFDFITGNYVVQVKTEDFINYTFYKLRILSEEETTINGLTEEEAEKLFVETVENILACRFIDGVSCL